MHDLQTDNTGGQVNDMFTCHLCSLILLLLSTKVVHKPYNIAMCNIYCKVGKG